MAALIKKLALITVQIAALPPIGGGGVCSSAGYGCCYDPLARGLALGAIAHGRGTARAVVGGELRETAAGIAMGLAAVLTSGIAPLLMTFLM